jgi:hypothetical protein
MNNIDYLRLTPAYFHDDLKKVKYYTTRQKLVEFLYPEASIENIQKILRKIKKHNVCECDEFRFLFEQDNWNFTMCPPNCKHEFGYCDSIRYNKKVIVINNQNIPNQHKILLNNEIFYKDKHLLVHKDVFSNIKDVLCSKLNLVFFKYKK